MSRIVTLLLCLWAAPVWADAGTAMATVNGIKGVLGSQVDTGGNLWVVVKNDPQIPWNVVAVNLCKVVRPHQARIFMVKMVDMASVTSKNKSKDWSVIGVASCGMVP